MRIYAAATVSPVTSLRRLHLRQAALSGPGAGRRERHSRHQAALAATAGEKPSVSSAGRSGNRRHRQVGRQAAAHVESALQLGRRPRRPRQQPPLLREPVWLQQRLQACAMIDHVRFKKEKVPVRKASGTSSSTLAAPAGLHAVHASCGDLQWWSQGTCPCPCAALDRAMRQMGLSLVHLWSDSLVNPHV